MELVVTNAIVYIIGLVFYIRKKKKVDVGFAILSLYTLCAIIGIPYYQSKEFNFELEALPYLYLFAVFFICFYPLLKFDSSQIKEIRIQHNRTAVKILMFFAIATSVETFFESLLIIPNFSIDTFAEMYMDEDGIYPFYTGLGKRCLFFTTAFQFITPILFFTYLSNFKVKKTVLFLFLCALASPILKGMVGASRGDIVTIAIYDTMVYLFVRNAITPEWRKRIKIVLVSLISIIVVGVMAISLSRFYMNDGNTDFSNYFVIYLGEGSINFNNFVWHQEITTEGDKTIALLKELLGYDVPHDPSDLQAKWYQTGVPQQRFYTFAGDFVSDYGKVLALLFFWGFNVLSRSILKKKSYIHIDSLLIIMLIISVYTYGYSLFAFRRYYQQIYLCINLFIYLYLLISRKLSQQ